MLGGNRMGKDLCGKELGEGLSQRKDGRYCARFTDSFGNRRCKYSLKLQEVKKWLRESLYKNDNGLLFKSDDLTVDTWVEYWLENYKKDVVKYTTYKNYRTSYIYHIKPNIGSLALQKVKPMQLQKILNDMYDDYAYGTINLVKITLHALFDGAIKNEYLVKNPAQHIKCKMKEVDDARVLTASEQDEFLKYAAKSMYFNAYALVLQTGIRPGELAGLKYCDIDYNNKTLSINRTLLFSKEKGGFYFGTPKTKGSKRVIPLTESAISLLKEQKVLQLKLRAKSNNWCKDENFSDLVFTTINGKPCDCSTFRNNLVRIVNNINKDRKIMSEINNEQYLEFMPIHMHSLRHSFATRAIENNMNPKTLQGILGHSNISTTMQLYVHNTDEQMIKEMKKVIPINGVKMA